MVMQQGRREEHFSEANCRGPLSYGRLALSGAAVTAKGHALAAAAAGKADASHRPSATLGHWQGLAIRMLPQRGRREELSFPEANCRGPLRETTKRSR